LHFMGPGPYRSDHCLLYTRAKMRRRPASARHTRQHPRAHVFLLAISPADRRFAAHHLTHASGGTYLEHTHTRGQERGAPPTTPATSAHSVLTRYVHCHPPAAPPGELYETGACASHTGPRPDGIHVASRPDCQHCCAARACVFSHNARIRGLAKILEFSRVATRHALRSMRSC